MNAILKATGAPSTLVERYMAAPEGERDAILEQSAWYQALPDDPRYKCQICQDSHTIIDEHNRARPCPCTVGIKKPGMKMTIQFQAFDALMRSDHWEGWPLTTFAEFQKRPEFVKTKPFLAAQTLWNELKSKGTGQGTALILCGANGSSKTLSGILLCAEAALAGRWATAIEFPRIVDLMKRGIDGQQKLHTVYSTLERAEFALLDEVGKETTSGNVVHAKEAIQRIIDIYYKQHKTLILISNMTLKEMNAYIPTRSLSRLQSGWGSFIEVPPGSPDLRRNKS